MIEFGSDAMGASVYKSVSNSPCLLVPSGLSKCSPFRGF